jgi:hypothetical protein
MYRRSISIGGVISVAVGLACSGIVVFDENGYVASMTFVIVFFLLLTAALIVLIAGLVGLAAQDRRIGVFLIVVSVLTPASFLAFCFLAKGLGIGAYREEPMISFPVSWSPKANIKALVNRSERA